MLALKRKRKSGKDRNYWCEQLHEGSDGFLERDSFRLVDKRVRFAGFSGKCLQAAVVASLQGHVRERVLRRLQTSCANNDGSGYGGTLREARNLEVVEKFLVEELLERDANES